jgi:hypothetical protein
MLGFSYLACLVVDQTSTPKNSILAPRRQERFFVISTPWNNNAHSKVAIGNVFHGGEIFLRSLAFARDDGPRPVTLASFAFARIIIRVRVLRDG